jgi:hypothetical protein
VAVHHHLQLSPLVGALPERDWGNRRGNTRWSKRFPLAAGALVAAREDLALASLVAHGAVCWRFSALSPGRRAAFFAAARVRDRVEGRDRA